MTFLKNCTTQMLRRRMLHERTKQTKKKKRKNEAIISLAQQSAQRITLKCKYQQRFTRIDTKFIKDHLIEDYIGVFLFLILFCRTDERETHRMRGHLPLVWLLSTERKFWFFLPSDLCPTGSPVLVCFECALFSDKHCTSDSAECDFNVGWSRIFPLFFPRATTIAGNFFSQTKG